MNGFGHFLLRVRAFQAYWAAAALLLAVGGLSVLGSRHDRRLARPRRHRPAAVHAAGRGAVRRRAPSPWRASARSSSTTPTSSITTRRRTTSWRARPTTRRSTRRFAADPQPKITAVKVAVDLYPREQQVRMRGQLRAGQQDGQAHRHRPPLVLPGPEAKVNKLEFGVPADARGRRRAASACAATSWRRRSLRAPPPTWRSTSTTGAHGFTNTGAFTDVEYNGSFVNGCPAAADHRLPDARRAHRRPRAQEIRAAARRAHARPRRSGGARGERPAPDADFITFETDVGTDEDQFAIAPGYLQKEWTRGRPPLLRIQDGQPDPQLLRVPVGALRGEEGPLERRRHRGLLPARARVQPRPDDRGHEVRARLLHGEFRALPAQAVPDHRVPALRRPSRSRSPTRFPIPRASASSRACAKTPRTTSTIRTT